MASAKEPIINRRGDPQRLDTMEAGSVNFDSDNGQDELAPLLSKAGNGDGDDFDPADTTWDMSYQKIAIVILSLVVFGVILAVPIIDDNQVIGSAKTQGCSTGVFAHRCLGLAAFVAILWGTGALPLHVTGLAVPVLVVLFNILPAGPMTKEPMASDLSAKVIAGAFFDPVILLFLGGLTFAAAMTKYGLSRRMAGFVFAYAGTQPRFVLLAVMLLSYFLSMWISNFAASVVMVSLVLPLLHDLPKGDNLAKAILMGIAAACNVGGMSTPIASPQNAIAVVAVRIASDNKESIEFLTWMAVAVPFTLPLLFIQWGILLFRYPTKVEAVELPKLSQGKLTATQWYVIVVVLLTIGGWCAMSSEAVATVFGNLGIVAAIPVLLFFGTGILTKKEYNSLSWNTLTLIGGGVALGVAAAQSCLLALVANGIASAIGSKGPYIIVLSFVSLMAVIANFLPHSVVGIIVIPVIASVGYKIDHLITVVLSSAIMDSGAVMLPPSSFPNANSFAAQDKDGDQILSNYDYISTGFILTLSTYISVLSYGYALMILVTG